MQRTCDLLSLLQQLVPVVRWLSPAEHGLKDAIGIALAAVGALAVCRDTSSRLSTVRCSCRLIWKWGIEIHIQITHQAVEMVHQIGGDRLKAFGVVADGMPWLCSPAATERDSLEAWTTRPRSAACHRVA